MLAGIFMQPGLKPNIVGSTRSKPPAAPIEGPFQQQRPLIQASRWPNDRLTVANLGHATLLMNFFGVRIISDPSLFERVGLSLGPFGTIGPHRLTAAPLKPSQLQQLDLVLVTHAHMDHLDIRSLEALSKSAAVVACSGCATLIKPLGYSDIRELKWGERTSVRGLTVTAMGANHWGKRWPGGRDYGFNSYVLEKNGHRMLLACDSALTDVFAPLQHNPPDVAAFSIGAYDPWIWNHADPEQVWSMFLQTGAHYLIPIHWGTFRLSKEPMDEPLRRLIAVAGDESYRIVLKQIGGVWTLPETSPKRAQEPRAAGTS
jgi:L-ascorbate metabolism protein UlaG (beta-lactamase superfamily)